MRTARTKEKRQSGSNALNAYRQLERRVTRGDLDALLARWECGRKLIAERGEAGRLPNGRVKALRNALRISDREISYRMQFADAHRTKGLVKVAFKRFGSWFAITQQGLRQHPPASDLVEDTSTREPDRAPPPRTVADYCRRAEQFRELVMVTIDVARHSDASFRKCAPMIRDRDEEIREALGELEQLLSQPSDAGTPDR